MKNKQLETLLQSKQGAMSVVIATTLPLFLGGVGLAVDVAQWTLAKRTLHRQADSGALAGIYGLAQGVVATASVNRDLALNLPFAGLFLPDGVRITAEATASLIATGDSCVLALENTETTDISMGDSSKIINVCPPGQGAKPVSGWAAVRVQ